MTARRSLPSAHAPMSARAGLPGRVRRSAGPGRGQDGYVLMFVLGIIALTSVVVIALLGLALTSARVAGQQAELARETRAADGALEAAVSDIARSGGEPCAAVGPAGQVAFAGPSAGTLDVDVACDSSGSPGAPDADLGGPRVEVVGDTPYGSGPAGGKVPVPSVSGVVDPTLVSTGTEPLAFNSDVVVNAGAAPLRSGGAPGVTVKGQYRQGDTVDGGCGALGVAGPSQIQDHNDTPVCGATAGDLAVAEDPSPSAASVPLRSIACPAAPGGVLALAPGGYTQAQVIALNDVLGGSCDRATVWFQPGVHVLDVNDPTAAAGDRHALVISDPDVRVVGGVPRGWGGGVGAGPEDFPKACDPAVSGVPDVTGVTLQLSGRSAIRHRAGRVALCPRLSGGSALPAIVQVDTAPVQPVLTGISSGQFGPQANLAADGGWAVANICFFGFFGASCPPGTITATVANTDDRPLSSARVLMDMQQVPYTFFAPDTPAANHQVPVSVTLSVSGPKPCSTGPLPSGRSYGGRQAFDLRAGGCSVLTNEADLEGAVLSITVAGDPVAWRGLDVYVKDVRLEVGQRTAFATSVGAADPPWSATATRALTPGGGAAVAVQEPLPDPPGFNPSLRLATPGGETSSFTVRDLTFTQPLDPQDEVSSLEVVMRSPTGAENYLSDPVDGSRIRFRLDGNGWSCSTSDAQLTRSHAQSNQELRYDLFLGGDCLPVVDSAGALDGADLTVTLTTGCTQSPYQLFGTKCTSVTLPEFDYVGLVATTNTVTAAPYSELSVNAAVGGDGQPLDQATSTSFDAFGPVILPRADLDIHWLGGVFPNRPIIAGRLQVHALGSDMAPGATMGIVCCTPLEGAGVLEASIDSVVRARAIVRTDDALPGEVTILDWKLCGRGGCGP